MTNFTPVPMVNDYGLIVTSFTAGGQTMHLKQDIEATREFIKKLEAAIEKANKNRVDSTPALP